MERPNVLVIMVDQMKATASHLYGSPFCETSSLERLARSGVLYRHAFTPHPLCVPARVSMWTGRYPHAHGARRNETLMPPGEAHAFRLWHEAGYRTGLIGKNHCFDDPADVRLFDTWCEIGHQGLPDDPDARESPWFRPRDAIHAAHRVRRDMPRQTPAVSYAVSDVPLDDTSTGLVTGQVERFLEAHREEPFALWVSFPDPHTPYEVPRPYADTIPPETVELPPRPPEGAGALPERTRVLSRILNVRDASEHDLRRLVATYHAMVRFVDDGVGRILDALERLGLREDTIVVFCSDHGDFAGEHGMTRKGGAFYDCLVRVPLVLSWPGRLPQDVTDASMVNLVDVVPTLLRLQGLDVPRAMQGRPLPTVTEERPRVAAFSEYGAGGPPFTLCDLEAMPVQHGLEASKASLERREAEGRRKMVRTLRWKYVTDPMGDLDELYDLAADPYELDNLAGRPAFASTVAELRSRLLDWSVLTEDARPVPLPDGTTERSRTRA